MSDRPILEVDGVGKSFGRKKVLTAASFGARIGRITVLLGRNGTGKTTMLRIAVGIVRADHGRVLYRGHFCSRPRLPRLAQHGLMYSDQASALTRQFSIEDHLTAYAQTFGAKGVLSTVVGRFRLANFLPRRPSELSGGERQRVSLALAVLRAPVCLLIDEPFAGVAPRDLPLFAAGLRELRDDGCAVVVSGHDVEDLMAIADEVIWVTSGTTHRIGAPKQAARHEQFRREYLGPRAIASRADDEAEVL